MAYKYVIPFIIHAVIMDKNINITFSLKLK